MRAAKLDVSIDAAGNILGRRVGSDNSLKPLLLARTSTACPKAGTTTASRLVSALSAQTLFEQVTTRHPLEVIIFKMRGGLIGKPPIDGELTEKELDLVSRSGKTIRGRDQFIAAIQQSSPPFDANAEASPPISNCISSRAAFSIPKRSNIGRRRGRGINWWDVTIEGLPITRARPR